MSARLRELLESDTINGVPIKDGRQVADLVAETIIRQALVGDIQFVKELLGRTEGKIPEKSAGQDDDAGLAPEVADAMLRTGLDMTDSESVDADAADADA